MITPMTSIQIPLRIAQATRLMISPLILSLQTVGIFWATWSAVYRVADVEKHMATNDQDTAKLKQLQVLLKSLG